MNARHQFFDATLGRFQAESVPDGTWCWALERECPDPWSPDPQLSIQVMTNGPDLANEANLTLVRTVAKAPERFIEAAILFVRTMLQRSPNTLGVGRAEAEVMLALPVAEFPLGGPSLVFYSEEIWCVHFTEGRFPICDPFGLIVNFRGQAAIGIEDISEGESLEPE
jgi:hypothetical protein